MLVPRRGTILARWARIPFRGDDWITEDTGFTSLRGIDTWDVVPMCGTIAIFQKLAERWCFERGIKSLFQGDEVWLTQFLVYYYFGWLLSLWLQHHTVSRVYWLTVDQNCFALIHWLYQYDHLSLFTFSGCTPKSPQKVLKCRGFLTKKNTLKSWSILN